MNYTTVPPTLFAGITLWVQVQIRSYSELAYIVLFFHKLRLPVLKSNSFRSPLFLSVTFLSSSRSTSLISVFSPIDNIYLCIHNAAAAAAGQILFLQNDRARVKESGGEWWSGLELNWFFPPACSCFVYSFNFEFHCTQRKGLAIQTLRRSLIHTLGRGKEWQSETETLLTQLETILLKSIKTHNVQLSQLNCVYCKTLLKLIATQF